MQKPHTLSRILHGRRATQCSTVPGIARLSIVQRPGVAAHSLDGPPAPRFPLLPAHKKLMEIRKENLGEIFSWGNIFRRNMPDGPPGPWFSHTFRRALAPRGRLLSRKAAPVQAARLVCRDEGAGDGPCPPGRGSTFARWAPSPTFSPPSGRLWLQHSADFETSSGPLKTAPRIKRAAYLER